MERQAIADKLTSNAPGAVLRARSRCDFAKCHLIPPRLEWLEARVLMSSSDLGVSAFSTAAIPSITVDVSPLHYAEKQGATPIDAGLTIGPANAPLIGAAVRLLGYMPGEDVLSVVPQNGISFWWDSSAGILDLRGPGPAAGYQAVLRSVTYTDPSYDPSTAPRTAQITVTDADEASGTASRSIVLLPTNDPPGVQTPPIQTTTAGSQIIFSSIGGNAIVVSDADADGKAEQVTLAAKGGTLRLAENLVIDFIAGTGMGDATMTIEGTLDAINASVNGLTFTPTGKYAETASLEVTADDLGNSGVGGAQIVNALIPIVVNGVAAPPPTVGDSIPSSTTQPPSASTTPPEPTVPQAPVLVSLPIPEAELAAAVNVPAIRGISTASVDERSDGTSSSVAQALARRIDAPVGATVVAPEHDMQLGNASIPRTAPRMSQSIERIQKPFEAQFSESLWDGQSGGLNRALGSDALLQSAEPTVSTTRLLPAQRWSQSQKRSGLLLDTPREASLSLFPSRSMLAEFDMMRRRFTSEVSLRIWAGTASLLSAGASVAYLLWLTRGGSLVGSLLSSIPAWKWVDPIPVLEQAANTSSALKRDSDDRLETIIRDAGGS